MLGHKHAWFADYLNGRSQRVVLDGVASQWAPATSGVLRGGGGGGILGPLYLFSFINNLPSVLSEGTQSALYSDDTKLYFVLFPGQPIVKDFD